MLSRVCLLAHVGVIIAPISYNLMPFERASLLLRSIMNILYLIWWVAQTPKLFLFFPYILKNKKALFREFLCPGNPRKLIFY